jgi:hypothetical protein
VDQDGEKGWIKDGKLVGEAEGSLDEMVTYA